MGVINGQAVNSATTNAAFLDSTEDDAARGILSLVNLAAASGSSIENIQREFNSIASFVGKDINSAKDDLPAWSASDYGATQNIKERVDELSIGGSQKEFAVTDGQAAADLAGESYSGVLYSSIVYNVEIIRGSTVFSNGRLVLQYINSTWRILRGEFISDTVDDGVTFSVSQTGQTAQLRVQLDSGAGSGTIKLRKVSFNA